MYHPLEQRAVSSAGCVLKELAARCQDWEAYGSSGDFLEAFAASVQV